MNKFLCCLLLLLMMVGCTNTKQFVYLNDLQQTGKVDTTANLHPIRVQPGDILQVTVTTIDKDISLLFNPLTTMNTSNINSPNPIAQGYLVDQQGAIELPLVGKINVQGKTTNEVNEIVKRELEKSIKNPFVATRLLNFRVSVLGDVARPGAFNIPNERVSLLDALSMAGDLNITAVRNDVLIIRETHGKKEVVSINLNDSKILSSPYYYLANNDVVYVKPGRNRVASSTLGFQLLPTILGALSLITVIVTTIAR